MKMTIEILKSLSHEEIVKVLGQLPNFDGYRYVAEVFNEMAEDEDAYSVGKIIKHIKTEHLEFIDEEIDLSHNCYHEYNRRMEKLEKEQDRLTALQEEHNYPEDKGE